MLENTVSLLLSATPVLSVLFFSVSLISYGLRMKVVTCLCVLLTICTLVVSIFY